MWAYLDLTWKPSASESTPPAGKAPAIIRGDSYAHTISITDGVVNGYDDWTFLAQIRLARLTDGTGGAALADFTVDLEADGDDLLVHLSLLPATTLALELPQGGFWDMQLSLAGVVTTWLSGKVKILDDVTRAA
jgi:hypothetical protein